ncbi:hypothetical protein GGS24DRAFT_174112 [Hypoxylon argillaceum]|nr:hypothetical protein GGS24DRAFT_174112 [Hypoxylon argillaceum]
MFFGVPNTGLNNTSFTEAVGDNPNRPFIDSLNQFNSERLDALSSSFAEAFQFRESSEIHSIYETRVSKTVKKNSNGKLSMGGEKLVLMSKPSATHCRPWENTPDYVWPLDRDHSDLVKFQLHDQDYDKVVSTLQGMVDKAVKSARCGGTVLNDVNCRSRIASRAPENPPEISKTKQKRRLSVEREQGDTRKRPARGKSRHRNTPRTSR